MRRLRRLVRRVGLFFTPSDALARELLDRLGSFRGEHYDAHVHVFEGLAKRVNELEALADSTGSLFEAIEKSITTHEEATRISLDAIETRLDKYAEPRPRL